MFNSTFLLRTLPVLVILFISFNSAYSQIQFNSLGATYYQDFNTLASTGATNDISTLPSGWSFSESGTNANTTYAGGTGSSNTGNTYSFGSDTTERAFGALLSGSVTSTIGANFTNATNETITSLQISYTGEQWRSGATGRGADKLDFQLSANATSLLDGDYIDINELDVTSLNNTSTGALNGNDSINRTNISFTIQGLSIPAGATFWIRWTDFNVASSDDGLAIDDFSIIPVAMAGPPVFTINDIFIEEGNKGFTEVGFVVSLGVPAAAGGVTYNISTIDSSAVAPEDYISRSLEAQLIAEGETTDTFFITINGDTTIENDEFFKVVVSNVTGATIADSVGIATIVTDDLPITRIYTIQGEGTASAMVGQEVVTEGIVTGNFQGADRLNGFFIQDSLGDNNDATSDGIFIYNPDSLKVKEGDYVKVKGEVKEQFSLTEITNVNHIEIISSGHLISPSSASLPSDNFALEHLEGMLVRFPQTLTISETYNLASYGELSMSANGRLYTPTNFVDPTDSPSTENENDEDNKGAVTSAQIQNNQRTIILDDFSNGNIPSGTPTPYLDSATHSIRVGSVIKDLTGVLDYGFNKFRIRPTIPPAIDYDSRPGVPGVGNADVKVASFNVLNYFTTLGSRGASTPEEFNRQRAKIISAIQLLNADVVGLIEIENNGDGTSSAIADLVNGLNTSMGVNTYAYIKDPLTGTGTDLIKLAIIYKPSIVTPIGFSLSDSSNIHNRPPVAQIFEVNSNGARFTFVVNHFKSKGCSDAVGLDTDQEDGQSCYNNIRKFQALALLDFIETLKEVSGDSDIISVGDYNAYRQEDPIDILTAGDLIDLLNEDDYSYVFSSQSGSLDHALITPSLANQVTAAKEWHINADEPVFTSYENSDSLYANSPYRSSDHDPVLIGLKLNPPVISALFFKAADTVQESNGKYKVVLLLDSPATRTASLNIFMKKGQNLEYDKDYTTTPASVNDTLTLSIQEGVDTVAFDINIINDSLDEQNESLTARIIAAEGTKSEINSFNITIEDDEPAKVSFALIKDTVTEGDLYNAVLNLTSPTTEDTSIKILIEDGKGIKYGPAFGRRAGDYTTSPDGRNRYFTLNIPEGSSSVSFSVQINHDVVKRNEVKKIDFRLSSLNNKLIIGSVKTFTLFIKNKVRRLPYYWIYPNPTSGLIKLIVDLKEYENVQIHAILKNPNGSIILNKTGTINQLQDDLSEVLKGSKRGIYFLDLIVEEEQYQIRIIKY